MFLGEEVVEKGAKGKDGAVALLPSLAQRIRQPGTFAALLSSRFPALISTQSRFARQAPYGLCKPCTHALLCQS